MQSYKLLLGLFLALAFWQCTKEDQIRTETETVIIEGADEVTFLIQIIDETGAALPGATLIHNLSGQTWTSDSRGLVFLDKLTVPSGGLPVTVESPGKMKRIKLLSGLEGSQTSLKLQLYPFDAETTIQTGATGSLDDGGELTLPDQLTYEDGSAYTGAVKVQSHYYNPAEQGFLEAAPGNMSAIGADGNIYTLESYGMYAVELSDASGNTLHLPDGATAKLRFPIPANYSSVPQEIPLWSMDEASGKWIEEGVATQQNGFVEAEVAHFSWWDLGVPFNAVNVCMRLVDPAGNPLPNLFGIITSVDQSAFYSFNWVYADGTLCTPVPKDQPFLVQVSWPWNPASSYVVAEIAALSEDTDLGDVVIDFSDYYHLSGMAVSCDNIPLTNVLVAYEIDGAPNYTVSNAEGVFRIISQSIGDVEIQLFGYGDGVQSAPLSVALDEAQSFYDLDQVMLCDDFNGVDGIDVVSDITENVVWTTGNTYILRNRVVVQEGATLTIEPGVVVKGDLGTGGNATHLVISQGARIIAEGTPEAPIVFTSIVDEITPEDIANQNYVSPNLTSEDVALWGGVLILGRSPISASNDNDEDISETAVVGLIPNDPANFYGGNNIVDDSGVLSYVSIRHGGVDIGWANEINGLTLGGVGTGTTIENIEVVACRDDGVELLGGTVNVENLVVWNADDDAFDVDQAWAGTLDNFVLFTPGSCALELDPAEGSLTAKHTLQNGTIVMNDENRIADRFLVDLDLGTQCDLKNIHYVGPFEAWQTVTNAEVDPETTFENVTFDIAPGDFNTLFDPEAPIPAGCSAGGSPQADVSVFNWTWTAQAGKLDGL
jgi:hypothetical protein